ncbi:hypothetical protein NADFUDRAFT_49452 [Nadsonia fulvescens var. elongata DSM 6958]|uniref:chitin synthase n=1 Tax=Nadsonia fulvescens var. elongata DSM 6958 TaxID=857566 RepID=A0A1E3PNX4_9ASCO|nr:hypothetical protein NADFUDRAFT_49452 [Nadsonia fulvescens var. elongata DSM 6958]
MSSLPLSKVNVPISATSLLGTLHETFLQAGNGSGSSSSSVGLDSSSVILLSPSVDQAFISRIWNHAQLRSEDQTILVIPTNPAAFSSFIPTVASFPNINSAVLDAFNVLLPFFTALTPHNISTRFHEGVGVCLNISSDNKINTTRIKINSEPFSSLSQLVELPSDSQNRVFDVFYYLLLTDNDHERTHLSLKVSPDQYRLLSNSGTYDLPVWVQSADDYALAQDWRDSLKRCGIKGETLRELLSILSGILLLGNDDNKDDFLEGASLLGISPESMENRSSADVIISVYSTLVLSIVHQLNEFLSTFDIPVHTASIGDDNDVLSVVNIIECSPCHKNLILKNIFDNSAGINKELLDDGGRLSKTPNEIMKKLNISTNNLAGSDPSAPAFEADNSNNDDSSNCEQNEIEDNDDILEFSKIISSTRIWNQLNLAIVNNTLSSHHFTWTSSVVSQQLRSWYLVEWIRKKKIADYTVDFDYYEFVDHYANILPASTTVFNVADWIKSKKNMKRWSDSDICIGNDRLWLSEQAWVDLEQELSGDGYDTFNSSNQYSQRYYEPEPASNPFDSKNNLIQTPSSIYDYKGNTFASRPANQLQPMDSYIEDVSQPLYYGEEYGLPYSDDYENDNEKLFQDEEVKNIAKNYGIEIDPEVNIGDKPVEVVQLTRSRKFWSTTVWAFTWWIPSPFLKYIGRMQRSEIRMAWREKFVLCFFILLLNGGMIFYMMFLQLFICPDANKVWDAREVSYHQGTTDYYASIQGKVYDFTKFYKLQHSDNGIKTTSSTMMQFAGMDLTNYFPPPLTIACPGLVTDTSIWLTPNSTIYDSSSVHYSGDYKVASTTTKLHNDTWYYNSLKPRLKQYYKGELVVTRSDVAKAGSSGYNNWVIINGLIYDFTNYFYTISLFPPSNSDYYAQYDFLDSTITDLVSNYPGEDITEKLQTANIDDSTREINMQCIKNMFYAGKVDFRKSAKCQAANYILLGLACLLSSVTLIKFVSALRFGNKQRPSQQEKFVICQIPVYTEDEDSLRLAIDSLTSTIYDNRRKLLFVICDGMIVGAGNDRPTPRIVLDIFGVDPKIEPPSLPFRSIGDDAKQLNYAKVYSGLYEYEGDIVPYIVVVKVGAPNETSKPGNRGKRDSQLLLMNFLNKVHYQSPMSPMELELFHQINNIIGIDPEVYEYVFMVDADTAVEPDSLNRLVAACVYDSRIAAVCGETSLQNEERSWWTMIQVYEYYISHHLAKAFESLFGSVTCLPGCFSLYKLRYGEKNRPLLISNEVIGDYSQGAVNTLHLKNLFSLGEDRYLTTLMSKYFPRMRFTFVPDAQCKTAAPEEMSVLLSQRRRWINSTIHNLFELLKLEDMCGFCFVGMRFVVFIDLIGTILLPSVVVYLGYLIYVVSSKNQPLPLISLIMIAVVYGLQAIIFIIKRQWQHVVWMIIYLIAYPFHSFLLPIYSFWNQDNFTWGNTRIVVGERHGKQLVALSGGNFDEKSIPLEYWSDYAMRNKLSGAAREIVLVDQYDQDSKRIFDTNTMAERSYTDNFNGFETYQLNDLSSKQDRGNLKRANERNYSLNSLQSHLMSDQGPSNGLQNDRQSASQFGTLDKVNNGIVRSPSNNQLLARDVLDGNNLSSRANSVSSQNLLAVGDFGPGHGHSRTMSNISLSEIPKSRVVSQSIYASNSHGGWYYNPGAAKSMISKKPGIRSASDNKPRQISSSSRHFRSDSIDSKLMLNKSRSVSSMSNLGDFGNNVGANAGYQDVLIKERQQLISNTIREILRTSDLDTVTKRHVRLQIEEKLAIQFDNEKISSIDDMIDTELANLI